MKNGGLCLNSCIKESLSICWSLAMQLSIAYPVAM
jgi:hypothetical protein